MASWVDSLQVCGDGAGAALLRGLGVDKPRSLGGHSVTKHIHVNVLPHVAFTNLLRMLAWTR